MKPAIKKADRVDAAYAIILGPEELDKKAVAVKALSIAKQEEVSFNDLPEYIKTIDLKRNGGS